MSLRSSVVFKGFWVCLAVLLMIFNAYATPVTISNGIQFKDTSGNIIHAHGGGVIKVGSDYYWFGENRNSNDTFYAVSCYRSTDLKTWEFRNNVLTQYSNSDLSSAKIERPKVIYCANTGKYVMWMHKENAGDYGQARAAVAVSSTVDGNYSYLGSFRPLNYMSRDCTLFVDTDGSAYFLSAANENADLHMYKLSSDYQSIASLVQKLFVGQSREAPCLFKRNGYYILITSGCTGWTPNQQKYAYATSMSGSWSGLTNIGNSTCYSSQGTYVLPVQGSSTTSYLFMADRWAGASGGKANDSAYVWLPLSFNSNTLLTMNWYDPISIDTATGTITGTIPTYYKIKNKNSGKLADVNGGSLADGTKIIQWPDNGGDNQRWQLIDAGSGYYKIKNKKSAKLMDVSDGSTANSAQIVQMADNGSDSQLWQRIDAGLGYYKLRNKKSGMLLEVNGYSTADGANITQYPDNGGANQQWQIVQ